MQGTARKRPQRGLKGTLGTCAKKQMSWPGVSELRRDCLGTTRRGLRCKQAMGLQRYPRKQTVMVRVLSPTTRMHGKQAGFPNSWLCADSAGGLSQEPKAPQPCQVLPPTGACSPGLPHTGTLRKQGREQMKTYSDHPFWFQSFGT